MMEALALIRKLELRPRRTIRVVLFTNEENGLRGATEYAKAHADELKDHVMAMEADSGGFAPIGFSVDGNEVAQQQAAEIASLLDGIGATHTEAGHAGADIGPLSKAGVPALVLDVDGSRYFDYHHTAADTLDKVNPDDLKKAVAAAAVLTYVVADMPERFGRKLAQAR
jgi:carboxypeptidase Q